MAKAAKDGRARRGRQGPRQDPRHAARDRPGARLVRGAGVSWMSTASPESRQRCHPGARHRIRRAAGSRRSHGWIRADRPGMTTVMTRRLRHSRRHRSADRRLHLRPARAGAAAAASAWPCATCSCRARFPTPSAADLAETARLLAGVPAETRPAGRRPGLRRHAGRGHRSRCARPIVALVHHPLCLEAGLSKARQDAAATRWRRRRWRWPGASSSPAATTARTLAADFAVPREQDHRRRARHRSGAARAAAPAQPLQLLAVGSVVPRKAYDMLVRALAPLQGPRLAARPSPARPTAAPRRSPRSHAAIAETGLGARIALAGARRRRSSWPSSMRSADLFVMPSLYEGYGMVLAEAMARGLPIVCTTGGAAAETVPDAAAIKVPPGDERALTRRHRPRAATMPALRRRMADAAWAAGQKLPRWEDTARKIAGVIKEMCAMSGFSAAMARPARAGRPSLAQPQSSAHALARHFDGWRPDHRRRPRLRHRLQPARHRAAARARAALDAGRLRPGAARRRRRAAHRLGRRRRRAGQRSSCCSRAPSASRCEFRRADLAGDLEARARARAPISSRRRRCSTWSRPSSSPGSPPRSLRARRPSTPC